MRRWGNYLLAIGLLVVVGGTSLFLPSRLLAWQDEQRVGRSEVWTVQEVRLAVQESLGLTEKLQLMQSDSVNSLSMDNGRHYTSENIQEKVKEELLKLKELGILVECDLEGILTESRAYFYVNTGNSEQSMMLWEGTAITRGEWQFFWLLDDETGKILRLHQAPVVAYGDIEMKDEGSVSAQSSGSPSLLSKQKLEKMLEAWGEYLECELVETGDQLQLEIREMNEAGKSELEQIVKRYMEEGLDREEAYRIVLRELGLPELADLYCNYGVYQDAKGEAIYLFFQDAKDYSIYLYPQI